MKTDLIGLAVFAVFAWLHYKRSQALKHRTLTAAT
jgi:hypothetical protein